MKFFKREKETATGSADEVNPVYRPSASLTGKSANSEDIQSARNSIQFLTNEFKTTADQQQVAAKRMAALNRTCLLYTSPSPRDQRGSRMPSSA